MGRNTARRPRGQGQWRWTDGRTVATRVVEQSCATGDTRRAVGMRASHATFSARWSGRTVKEALVGCADANTIVPQAGVTRSAAHGIPCTIPSILDLGDANLPAATRKAGMNGDYISRCELACRSARDARTPALRCAALTPVRARTYQVNTFFTARSTCVLVRCVYYLTLCAASPIRAHRCYTMAAFLELLHR